jgi:hypothetical protein
MALASIANWLFNFAIGFFIPPAFQNISWKLFIIFGILCVGAAAQAYVSYPETAGKTIEEIELLFSKVCRCPFHERCSEKTLKSEQGAPRPWKTKPGNSLLDAKIAEVTAQHRRLSSAAAESEGMDVEKMHEAYEENKVL